MYNSTIARITCTCGLLVLLFISSTSKTEVEAKKQHSKSSLSAAAAAAAAKCQDRECELSDQHFVLYATVKRALDSEFNLSGKELVPMLRSIDILRKRFVPNNDESMPVKALNGSDLVLRLLNNDNLKEALKVFDSDEGRELITFYRASVNGRGQNLACSQMRIDDLERVTARVESSREFHNVFAKINKNYLKKSAKKCLKHSCTSVEVAMTKLSSFLSGSRQSKSSSSRNRQQHLSVDHLNDINPSIITSDDHSIELNQQQQQQDTEKEPREFQAEERELCKFLKRTNETDCKISGTEMGKIDFLEPAADKSILVDYLKSYAANNMPQSMAAGGTAEEKPEDRAGRQILAQCRSMSALLDYNLSPLKWYRERGLIDEQKLASRAFWCKGLSYWIQIDLLCGELESRLKQQLLRSSSSLSANVTTTSMPTPAMMTTTTTTTTTTGSSK